MNIATVASNTAWKDLQENIKLTEKHRSCNTQFVVSKTGKLLASYRKNHLYTLSTEPDVYAEINKEDITNLSKVLPLAGSFKEQYRIH